MRASFHRGQFRRHFGDGRSVCGWRRLGEERFEARAGANLKRGRFIGGGNEDRQRTSCTSDQTGAANTVTIQTNNCNCLSAGAQRPDVVSNPNLPSEKRALSSCFNTAAFAQPAAYTFRNAGLGVVRGPGLMNDFSVPLIFV